MYADDINKRYQNISYCDQQASRKTLRNNIQRDSLINMVCSSLTLLYPLGLQLVTKNKIIANESGLSSYFKSPVLKGKWRTPSNNRCGIQVIV